VLDRGLSALIEYVLSDDIKGWSTMSKSGKVLPCHYHIRIQNLFGILDKIMFP
jgi:hypothetical protein